MPAQAGRTESPDTVGQTLSKVDFYMLSTLQAIQTAMPGDGNDRMPPSRRSLPERGPHTGDGRIGLTHAKPVALCTAIDAYP